MLHDCSNKWIRITWRNESQKQQTSLKKVEKAMRNVEKRKAVITLNEKKDGKN